MAVVVVVDVVVAVVVVVAATTTRSVMSMDTDVKPVAERYISWWEGTGRRLLWGEREKRVG